MHVDVRNVVYLSETVSNIDIYSSQPLTCTIIQIKGKNLGGHASCLHSSLHRTWRPEDTDQIAFHWLRLEGLACKTPEPGALAYLQRLDHLEGVQGFVWHPAPGPEFCPTGRLQTVSTFRDFKF